MDQFHSELLPETEQSPVEEKSGELRRFLLDILETLVFALVLYAGINSLSARIRVESVSMQPTLYASNFIILNKVAYKIGQPHRGDIIVFQNPHDPRLTPYIKRVIGLPGEVVRVRDGKVIINGSALDEPYIKAPPRYTGEWVVPAESLFVLGDNRNLSEDSHEWGMVPIKHVIGKAWVVYWPPTAWKWLTQPIALASQP